MKYTVLGASGFIGSHLIRWLQSQGHACWAPERDAEISGQPLGHAIYCIGVTADFRKRCFDTVRAHVCTLLGIFEKADFDSFLYVSSARIYAGRKDSSEDESLCVNPGEADQLYNISKIMGESLCLSSGQSNTRVVRLSNVYGRDFRSDNFLFSVLRDAVDRKKVILRTSLDSERDYVNVHDVVRILPQIAASGRHRIYNVASGVNTSNRALLELIQRITGCRLEVAEGATALRFPRISIERIQEEFDFVPSRVLDSLPNLIGEYQRRAQTT